MDDPRPHGRRLADRGARLRPVGVRRRQGASQGLVLETPGSVSDPGPRVAVVGAGAWGTTLALLLARREPVALLTHSAATAERIRTTRRNEPRLPGIDLPMTLLATDDPSALTTARDLVVFAVPSSHLRSEVARVAASIPP